MLAHDHGRLCVVGDDAQSIYSFRGANIDNILNFQKMFVGARLFKLEQNYRGQLVPPDQQYALEVVSRRIFH